VTSLVGTRIGSYEISARIGVGGMGEVYRARDSRLNRDVAVKLLLPSMIDNSDRLARFNREAQALASLNHPNIAQIYGLERAEAQQSSFIVMEFVEGEELAQRIARGPLPIDEAIAIARQIAEALDGAHSQGIVHRDLKPANIKIRPDGTVKVLDFGLAKAADPAAASDVSPMNSPTLSLRATHAGMILGTAAYMSPEQARGQVVDKRSDIWAFGAVFYEMVTGQRAFAGEDIADVLASVIAREPDWSRLPADLPASVARCVKRCLHRDPRRRLRDIGDMLLALEGAFDDGAAVPRAAVPATSRWRSALPIAATAAIALAIGWVASQSRRSVAPVEMLTRFDVTLPSAQAIPLNGRPMISVAPDGRSLAYGTFGGVYIRDMASVEPRLVPGTAGTVAAAPFYSPDGLWIGYFTLNELRKVPVVGGSSTVVATVNIGLGGSWPDQQSIVFSDRRGVMRVPANGGNPEVIIPAKEGERLYGPRLLPDGSVLFALPRGADANQADGWPVVVQSVANGRRTVITQSGNEPRYVENGYITFVRNHRLFAVRFDLKQLALVGSEVPIQDDVHAPVGVTAIGADYDISTSGTLIYRFATTQPRSIAWIDRSGKPAGEIPGVPAGQYEDPRLSPDGRRLLITRDNDIWIFDVETGRNSRLTRDHSSRMGVWNPAGTEIAYSSVTDGNLEAWIAPADGSGAPRQITRSGGIVHVDSWSPDGRIVSVHQHRGLQVSILMVDVQTPDRSPQPFIDVKAVQAEGADFARDGRHVVYLATDTGQREVYVRPFPEAGGASPVSVSGGREPRWAANGEIFYRSLDGTRMFSAKAATTPSLKISVPEERFKGEYYVAPTGSPRPQYDVTADGQRFVMLVPTAASEDDRRTRIVVVQHWIDELRRRLP
jgi:serine/threonine-protein kinase